MRLSRRTCPRGSAISMIIILSVVLTALVMTLAWSMSVHANMAGAIPKRDAAFYAAEAYGQQAMFRYIKDTTWRNDTWSIPANAAKTKLPADPICTPITMYGTTWNAVIKVDDGLGDATLAWKFDDAANHTPPPVEGTLTSASGINTTKDATNNGNDGQCHGGTRWTYNAKSGSAMIFNGIDSYVDCSGGPSTNITGEVTVSAWVQLTTAYHDQKIGGNQDGVTGGYKLAIYNLKPEFEVRNSANKSTIIRDVAGGTTLTIGAWYNIVGTYSEAAHTIKVYCNGKLDRELTGCSANALGGSGGNFIMGKEPYTNLRYFAGSLDDVRVYGRCLSDTEVKAIYDTSVDVVATTTSATGGMSNQVGFTVSIPTPPAKTAPTISTATNYTMKNSAVIGDVSVVGSISGNSPASTISGNLIYTSGNAPSNIAIAGTSTKVTPVSNVKLPDMNPVSLSTLAIYRILTTDANTYGWVDSGSSANENFYFNGPHGGTPPTGYTWVQPTTIDGSKVIYIKGTLTDPTVAIGGKYWSGGTFIVDGDITFTKSATFGSPGYPVYFVTKGNIKQTGGTLNINGGLYAHGKIDHKDLNLTGIMYADGAISNSAAGKCTFTNAPIPWFDQGRATPQPATGTSYTSSYRSNNPS